MRSWISITRGRSERTAYCVIMTVRVLVTLCGSVQEYVGDSGRLGICMVRWTAISLSTCVYTFDSAQYSGHV